MALQTLPEQVMIVTTQKNKKKVKSNLILRTVTGILFVAVIVCGILYNPLSFGCLFVIISALSLYEFGKIINRQERVEVNALVGALGGAYLFMAFMAYCIDAYDSRVFIPYLLLLMYLMISELYLRKESPLQNWAFTMMGQMYVALPFALLNVLAFHSDPLTAEIGYNPILPLSVFIFLWLNDTGAYCVGSVLGKHRLFERISPKKSWEGFFGGLVLCLLASIPMAQLFPFLPVEAWAGLALVVVVFGTWGDLTESLLKRQLQIKDSGNILPGHGGMLDRFDSSLMAIPAAVVYLYFVF
jgi:phosphatidate cytidylyltransferase